MLEALCRWCEGYCHDLDHGYSISGLGMAHGVVNTINLVSWEGFEKVACDETSQGKHISQSTVQQR